jgi:hypothetical protein
VRILNRALKGIKVGLHSTAGKPSELAYSL